MRHTMKLMLLAVVAMASPSFAQEKGKMDPAAEKAMMEKWAAYATPNENHKVLEQLVGTYDHTMRMWMTPGATPEKSSGTTVSKWIMGGRFVEGTVSGTTMGQPFEGRNIIGYDNEAKEYVGVWIDSMATGMMHSKGKYNAATQTMNEACNASCPFEGTKKFRGETKFKNGKVSTYKMFTNDQNGKEFLMMEIVYSPKK